MPIAATSKVADMVKSSCNAKSAILAEPMARDS